MLNTVFLEVAAVIMAAGALSLIASKLRQPLIIAYILTGILVGPGLLGFTQSNEIFEVMSSIGIAFLLFIVGLNLNWRNIKEVGRVALVAGVSQVLVTSIIGTVIGHLLGLSTLTSLFLGVGFSFSSTIIIVKLLTDKEDLDRLYGRIAVGILVVQDLIAMMVLLVLAALGEGGDLGTVLSGSLMKGTLAILFLALMSYSVVPKLFRYAAGNQELLFLMALTWCFVVASALQLLGFGIEIGALLAGVTLAGTGFQHEIEAKIRPLRDFFLVIFFIVLGTQLNIGSLGSVILPALAFTAYVFIGNPIVMQTIMRFMGYHQRTAFMTGMSFTQISEFSFIMLATGIASGFVDDSALAIATIVGLLTIAGSSYLIGYNESLYDRFSFLLPRSKEREIDDVSVGAPEVILLGYDYMGKEILPKVKEISKRFAVVDFNPAIVEELLHRRMHAVYGDAGDEEVLAILHAERAKLIISTIPDMSVNAGLLDYLKQRKSRTAVVVTVKSSADAGRCYDLGATFVIVPSILSGQRFGEFLKLRKTKKTSWKTLGNTQAKMHQQA